MLAPRRDLAKGVAVVASGLTLALSLWLFGPFGSDDLTLRFGERYADGFHFVEKADWIATSGGFKIEYYLGVDGLSFPLIILTTVISFLACLASWRIEEWKINKGVKAYFVLFLLLETGMLGTFVALDFFLFYVFWEVMLLPMYFLIGVWGGTRKEYAAIKFFLYTLLGSVLMLVAMLAFYFKSGEALGGAGTFDLVRLATDPQIREAFGKGSFLLSSWSWPIVMFVFLFVCFAVKIPVFPFHTWLPDAHVEAPTPISMILAGVLLKMGAYGLMRISYPILPEGATYCAYGLAVLGVINILYGALCAMAQTDFKKLVAYSSISHMGYVLLGLAVMTDQGFQGAMFQVIAHGISSPMCFFLVGVIYDRAHHREINRFGGLWLTMPVYGSLATLGFFASLGLPGLCGFIGEVYVLLGTFNAASIHPWMTWAKPMAVIAAFGVVLTAGYILWLIQRVYLGPEKEEYAKFQGNDATAREIAILAPLGALAIVLGVLPRQSLFEFMNGTLGHIVHHVGRYAGGG
ncbi:MAG: NADH-quinone oxidoreductase subunit M [Phycisphaerae bacterium]|nr:NADH-quinone oxidoreductase subunit M [Phycisphaerae bacterium]